MSCGQASEAGTIQLILFSFYDSISYVGIFCGRPEVWTLLHTAWHFRNQNVSPLPSPKQHISFLKALAMEKPVDAIMDSNTIGRMDACEI
ncbi:hypothetical protein NC652_012929 [Populus alba x Populus x berolinensis]|nr:hypothetical protein NC652_012479 [Populus alba x Populus x berolinensis]KAJ6928915.1 hypothetical protein NC652_012929 [Populus alba x Populus x berolinensis]